MACLSIHRHNQSSVMDGWSTHGALSVPPIVGDVSGLGENVYLPHTLYFLLAEKCYGEYKIKMYRHLSVLNW